MVTMITIVTLVVSHGVKEILAYVIQVIFGAELICRVSLAARGGLRARDGKKAGQQE